MTIQASMFPDGGCVGHKVRINADVSPMTFSVWYSPVGSLLDVEAFDARGRGRSINRTSRAWRTLATMYGYVFNTAKINAQPAHVAASVAAKMRS